MFKKRGEHENHFFGRHQLWIAIATLMGTVIGAGILGIPYVVAKAGFLYGFLLIIIIGTAFLYLNLFTAEIILRTKGKHQLTGYAEKYLGKTGKILMTFALLTGIYGALTAYLIGEGETLRSVFGISTLLATLPVFLQDNFYILLFFIIAVGIVIRGLKAAGKTELISISLLVLIVILTGIFSYDHIDFHHFTSFNPLYLFLPYGVILFACVASPSIPEVTEILAKEKKNIKKAILIGSIVPVIIYLLFAFIIVGLVGAEQFDLLQPNQRIATVALSVYASPYLGLLANLLAILAMFTSFLTLGIALVEMYQYDYKFPRWLALLLTFSIPLALALGNFSTFFIVLGFTGVFSGGLDGILLMLMYWKAKKQGDRTPEFFLPNYYVLGGLIILFLTVGIIQQVWGIFS